MKPMSKTEQLEQELAELCLSEARKNAILETLKGEKPVRKKRRVLNTALIAAALCVLLAVSALALSPGLREQLAAALGTFEPYSQTIEGAICADQGIEIQVLSALADDIQAQVYLSARDVEEDRLDQCLTLIGKLTTGAEKETEVGAEVPVVQVGGFSTSFFKLLSYDPETKTALLYANVLYGDHGQPTQQAQLNLTGMTTQEGNMGASVSCASVTGTTLKSLPLVEGDRVISKLSDFGWPDALLPSQQVVLAPGQTPMPIEGTEDMWVSSMGFASDGCFHVRLEYAQGVEPEVDDYGSLFYSDLLPADGVERGEKHFICQETAVEGGMDLLFPMVTAEDAAGLSQVRFYGLYTRPGVAVEGSWSIDFRLDYYPSVTLDWTGELAGRQVTRVTVSPLTITMNSSDWGGFSDATIYAVKKDGSTIAAAPGTGRYSNVGEDAGETIWDTYNTWKFEEPVDVEDLVSLTLLGETIPLT